jgi:hypothetical protein
MPMIISLDLSKERNNDDKQQQQLLANGCPEKT